jgi:uncharacterized protein
LAIPAAIVLILVVVVAARRRRFLAPAAAGFAAGVLALGAVWLVGSRINLATVAMVPAVAGLVVALALLLRPHAGEPRRAESLPAPRAAPAVAAAAALVALVFSPAPMVRSFGLVAAAGALLARPIARALAPLFARGSAAHADDAPSSPRIGDRLRGPARAGLRQVTRRAWVVVAVAALLAIVGWAIDLHRDATGDLARLGPDDRASQDGSALRRQTGFAGDASVLVRAKDVTAPAVVRWMAGYQRRILAREGYSDRRPCSAAQLCPELSLTALLGAPGRSAPARLFGAASQSFSRAVISRDHRSANVAFAVKDESADRTQSLLADMRRGLDPPGGVHAELAGASVVDADASRDLDRARFPMALGALVLAFLVLLLRERRYGVAVVLVPAAFATGLSGLVAALIGLPLDPLSSSVAVVAVAVSATIATALADRLRLERTGSGDLGQALEQAYAGAGAPLAAFSLALAAGIAAPIASGMRMTRDFAITATVDLLVVALATAIVLPATIVAAEGLGPVRLPRTRKEAADAAIAAASLLRAAAITAWRRSVAALAAARATGQRAGKTLRQALARVRRLRGRRRGEAQRP